MKTSVLGISHYYDKKPNINKNCGHVKIYESGGTFSNLDDSLISQAAESHSQLMALNRVLRGTSREEEVCQEKDPF